jgi:uncharacterized membrane protein
VKLPINWNIEKCLILSLVILLAMFMLVGLAGVGIDIPLLPQVIGFVFLTFVPGILILRVLKIHNTGVIESLAYSVGLSLASVMFVGALINFALPFIGVARPLSLLPVAISMAVFTLILMAVAYLRDRDFREMEESKPVVRLKPGAVLLLALLFLMVILSVVLIDTYKNNILLLIAILAIAAVVGLAVFDKFIKPEIYPLAIFVIGLCLLYQTSLLSPYLVGTDIYVEYHFYQLAASNGFWNVSIPSTVNSCLSITMLAPIYSLIMNIDGIWMFKAVYPLFFALVPVILFYVFNRQMSSKKAFLAAFFFIIVPTFSLELPALCRQQVAELFLSLIILLLIDRKLHLGPKMALIVVFALSMIVAHYALGVIGSIFIVVSLLCVIVIRNRTFRKAWAWLTKKTGGLPDSFTEPGALPIKALAILLFIYLAFGFLWYGVTASGVTLDVFSNIWSSQLKIVTSGVQQLLSTTGGHVSFIQLGNRASLIQTALGLDFTQVSMQGKIFRIFQYLTELFLIIGILRFIFRPGRMRFTPEFIGLSVTGAGLILASIAVPTFARLLNTTRIYHIALITLAPFLILGSEGVWWGISWAGYKIKRAPNQFRGGKGEDNRAALIFTALAILMPYFLFTSGFTYEVTGQKVTDKVDTPYSIALSSYRLDLAGVFSLQDGAAADWLSKNANNETNVYVDSHGFKILGFYDYPGKLEILPGNGEGLKCDNYIYLTGWNVLHNQLTYTIYRTAGLRQHINPDDIPGLKTAIENKNKIYDNGASQVLSP